MSRRRESDNRLVFTCAWCMLASVIILSLWEPVTRAVASGIGKASIGTVQDEGGALAQEPAINFIGAGVTCVDDAGNTRSNCTIPGGGGTNYQTMQDEGGALTQRAVMDFAGAGVTCVDSGGSKSLCTIPGGGATQYQTMQDEGGALTQRAIMDFAGAGVTCVDSGGTKSLCTIPGGGAGAYEVYPDADAVPAAGWSWDNQVAATENVDGLGRRTINTAVTTGGTTGRFRTMVASINYTVTIGLIFQQGISALSGDTAGICVREAATTELVCFFLGIDASNLGNMHTFKRDSATTFNGSYTLVQNVHYLPLSMGWPLWLRIQDNGTNLLFSVSHDGENFVQYDSQLRTDFLTADEVGFYTVLGSPGFLTLFSYEEI